ncbi:hypothetical protein GALMADRAFT_54100 [Galerina marginata CBS 339.88]|uniref:RRM domain-containing protein n=1 Tax=Galerina marginata (strain CBS 339.88) TaxID=685588 RepID=A0A067U213_GALM3|nr:hypothetical protein GALMADRAFT_54100 [Galerina marginata CBS 339.88]
MSSTQKLTKKQKKGLAFRERKIGKAKNGHSDTEDNAVPFMEDQDRAGSDGDTPEVAGGGDKKKGKATGVAVGDEVKRKEGRAGSKGTRKTEAEDVPVSVEMTSLGKKRKRGNDETGRAEGSGQPKKALKRKKTDGGADETGEKKNDTKQRYILFVGNLKYTTTLDAINEHFASCDPSPTVRLLTPKSAGPSGPTQRAKSKGCAFLEFTHRNALQQGLKLHQSQLDGRMINVELTAGGGGKSESRLSKVRERNKALLGQREERIEKEASQDNSFPNLPSKPQRFSATSGLEQKPITKRTWTVGDVDDGETHRGGQRHRERGKSKKSKAWGTGVNAIPVG